MRKQIAVFSLILLISPVLSIEINQIESYNADKEIRDIQIDQKSVFLASKNGLQKISTTQNWTKKFDSIIIPSIDLSSNYLIAGTKVTTSDLLIFERDGNLVNRVPLRDWVDDVSLIDSKMLFSGSTIDYMSLYYINGTKVSEQSGGLYERISQGLNSDIDNDGETEILVQGSSRFEYSPKFEVVEVDGTKEWQTERKDSFTRGMFTPNDNVLVRWANGLSLRLPDGTEKWNLNTDSTPGEPLFKENYFMYSNSSHLVKRGYENGEQVGSIEIGSRLSYPELYEDLIIGRQGKNLSIFSVQGEKFQSSRFENGIQDIQLTDFEEGGDKEIAVVSEKKIFFHRIGEDQPETVNQSLSETVFVGHGKEMLKAAALNQTSFITENYDKVRQEVEETGLEPVSVNVEGPNQIDSINQAFNISKPKYYAGSREKAVYVAALAAKNNATLTFEKSEANRDFSNKSVQQLQDKFIEEFEPNHLTVTDLGSDKGLLAGYMAAKQGSLPIDFDQEYSYPEEDVNAIRWNKDNGVISLDQKIEDKFEKIGENQNTIFDGKYVSILSGPRKLHSDPVEGGFISDPEDGSSYHSDLSYGNLDNDRMIEAGVGRYPTETSQASLVFHRSMEREIGENAIVASEYLNSNWPVILATFGGGMRHGEVTTQVLEREGFNTTQLVERRSQPVAFLFDLAGVPTQMDIFVKSVDLTQAEIGSILTQGSARAIKNAAYLIRGLQYGEKAMEMYFEFEWGGWEPTNQKLDVPEEINREEFGNLVLSFLPDSKTRLNEENLIDHMKTSDIIHYQGIGNDDGWVLPNNDSSKFISDRYNGTNSIEPDEIPELGKPIVFDSTNLAGSRNSEMRDSFFDKGASAFIGFSGVNYAAYSSHIDQVFFRRGKTLGNSLKRSVNSLRQGPAVFHPSSSYINGVSEKMKRSASLYGNPEMPKDPISSDKWNIIRNCENFECKVEMKRNPEYEIRDRDGKKLLRFNTTNHLLVPGAPITPLYSADYKLPQNAGISDIDIDTEYKEIENVYLPETELLSHSGNYTNISDSFEKFPENLSNTTVSERELRHVQAGLQKQPNSTMILENISLEFSYTTPISMEVSRENRKATAIINSRKEFEGELIYSIGENKTSRNVEIQKGENRFDLGEVDEGITEVEVYLIDQEIVEQVTTDLKLKKDPEIQVFAPDIHRGDVRKVKAVIENRNNFEVTEHLSLKTNSKVQLGMLENESREITLDPHSSKQVSWRFTGIEKGNSSIKLRNSSDNLTVKPSRSTDQFLGTGQFYQEFSSPYRSYSKKQTDSELVLEVETELGQVRLVETPEFEYSEIETDNFKASRNQSRQSEVQKVRTSEGFYARNISNGVESIESENISDNKSQQLLVKLDEEVRKLKEIGID